MNFLLSSNFSLWNWLGREEIIEPYNMYFLQDKHFN